MADADADTKIDTKEAILQSLRVLVARKRTHTLLGKLVTALVVGGWTDKDIEQLLHIVERGNSRPEDPAEQHLHVVKRVYNRQKEPR